MWKSPSLSIKPSGEGPLKTDGEKRRDTVRAKVTDATTKALNLYADTPPKGEMFKNTRTCALRRLHS